MAFDGKMEAIDVIEAYGLNFALGNAVKYILRCGGMTDAVADLEKARAYLTREIERRKRGDDLRGLAQYEQGDRQ